MDLLIKKVKIIDANSQHHQSVCDVLIEKGIIQKIAKNISKEQIQTLELKDLHLSNGWIDLNANIQDPGYEEKEDLNSGIKSAAAGGFTRVALSPSTLPTRDSKTQIEYILTKAKNKIVEVFAYGNISKNQEGKELAELSDMYSSGAVGFTDGKHPISNPNLMHRALLYAQAFNGLIISFPYTQELSPEGVMNEGTHSTLLGLKGIPALAEELMVARDLYLLEHTAGRLHFASVSSPTSIDLIQKAKSKGLNVSCALPSYLLLLDDSNLKDFDSRLKTLPPLREKATVKKLNQLVKNGSIKALCSDHWPQDIDSKMKEFDYADFGIINLQTAFAVANTALSSTVDLTAIIELFTSGPADILGISNHPIEEGAPANLTLFQPNEGFTLEKKAILSKSKNSPFIGKKLTGRVIGIVNRNKIELNN